METKKSYGTLRLWLWTITPLLCFTSCNLLSLTKGEFYKAFGDWATFLAYDFVVLAAYGSSFFVPLSFFVWIWLRNMERETVKPNALSLQRTVFILGVILYAITFVSMFSPTRAR